MAHPLPRFARRLTSRTGSLIAVLAASAVVTAGCGMTSRNVAHTDPPMPAEPTSSQRGGPATPSTFLTTTSDQPDQTLQLRSADTGHVLRLLAHGRQLDGVRAADGSIVVVSVDKCRSTIQRLDPRTDMTHLIRTLSEPASGIALSPDGTRLAYLTRPSCTVALGSTDNKTSNGVASFLPNVLAIVDLGTGARVSTATDSPGHPFFTLSWSPDGQQVALGYAGDTFAVLLTSATQPDFRSATRLSATPGCAYFAPAWTSAGIVVAEGCQRQPVLSPRLLVRVDPDGQVSATWQLPPCIDGVQDHVDATHRHVLVSVTIGYGNDACSQAAIHGTTRIATLVGGQLKTLTDLPRDSVGITGW